MIYGIGDSNLEFEGYGYAGALADLGVYGGSIFYGPGRSAREIRLAMQHRTLGGEWGPRIVDPKPVVLITVGINDVIQDEWPWDVVRHVDGIMDIARRRFETEPRFVWMPSHPTGHWKIEALRLWMRAVAWFRGIQLINLREWRWAVAQVSKIDPWHLQRPSYETLAIKIKWDIRDWK